MYKHNNGPATAAIVAAALAAASTARLTIQPARKTSSISLSNYFIRKSQWQQQQDIQIHQKEKYIYIYVSIYEPKPPIE